MSETEAKPAVERRAGSETEAKPAVERRAGSATEAKQVGKRRAGSATEAKPAGKRKMGTAKRSFLPEDLYRLRIVADPQLSPDGALVAYLVAEHDEATDDLHSSIWVA